MNKDSNRIMCIQNFTMEGVEIKHYESSPDNSLNNIQMSKQADTSHFAAV